MKRFLAVYVLLILNVISNAQFENMLHKTYKDKLPYLVDFHLNKVKIKDDNTVENRGIVNELRKFGVAKNDKSLIAEADLIDAWIECIESPNKKLRTTLIDRFIANSISQKDYVSAARAYRMLGEFYWRIAENYELAFENYLKNIEIGNLLSENEYPEKMLDYSDLGFAFYHFKEYKQAISYLKKGLNFPPPNPKNKVQSEIRNTIGLCYQKLNNLDSSDYFLNEVLKNETDRHEEWVGIASGNLGYNQYLRGNYKESIPLLKSDVATAIKFNDLGLASGSLVPLAEICLKKNNLSEAEQYALQAKSFVEISKQTSRYEKLYPLLSKIYTAKGNKNLAQQYLDSSLIIKEIIANKFNNLLVTRAQQKIESSIQKETIRKLEAEKKTKLFQSNLLFGFLLVLAVFSFYYYRQIRKQHKQEQQIKDLHIEQKQSELKQAEDQLISFSATITEKAQLLSDLETQLELKGQKDVELINQLRQCTLLNDEQWSNFRQLFEKVHTGFFIRLKEKLPDLTPAEIRFAALAKLQFNNKEMASALGISHQTIRVTAHRFRKKLQLPEEVTILELINSI